jgi:hypothetical protein
MRVVFPGAVWPQQGEDLLGGDLEVGAVERPHLPLIDLNDAPRVNGRWHEGRECGGT